MDETTRWADGAVGMGSHTPDLHRRLVDLSRAEAEFERQFSIAGALGANPQQLRELAKRARRLSRETALSAMEAAGTVVREFGAGAEPHIGPSPLPDHRNLLRKLAEATDSPRGSMNRKQRRALARTGGRRG